MFNDKVEVLREMLNSIVDIDILTNQDILEASQELDTVIVEYCKITFSEQGKTLHTEL